MPIKKYNISTYMQHMQQTIHRRNRKKHSIEDVEDMNLI